MEKIHNNHIDNENLIVIDNRIYYYDMIENDLFYIEDLKTSSKTKETNPEIISIYKHHITNNFIINNIKKYCKLYNNKIFRYNFDNKTNLIDDTNPISNYNTNFINDVICNY